MEESIKQLRLWASQAKPPNARCINERKVWKKHCQNKRVEKPILEKIKNECEFI